MQLQILPHRGDVTQAEFAEYLARDLGPFYERALEVFRQLGLLNSFRVTNLLYLSVQKGIVEVVLSELERWVEIAYRQYPPPVPEDFFLRREVDTKQFFDAWYAEFFTDELPRLGRRLIIPGEPTSPSRAIIIAHR